MDSTTAAKTTTKRKVGSKAPPSIIMEDDPAPGARDRLDFIATAAYYKAAARGFVPGMEIDDWLDAEAEFGERELQ